MGERTSFYKFFKQYKIVVPIIQRDYAQGRKTQKANDVRDNFIKSIFRALDKGESTDFNFVYGYEGADHEFYPVDGQQRLTTLYLLHWLIYVKIGEFDDVVVVDDGKVVDVMKNGVFTYQTRTSSTEFFSWLQDKMETISKMLADSPKSLEEIMINSSDYQSSWKNDPTVSAAIVMLDALNEKLKNEDKTKLKEYWDKLKADDPDDYVIFFQVISEEIDETDSVGDSKKSRIRNLTDKTYIRMNARGKELTPFENVKAMIDAIDIKAGNKKLIETYELYYADAMYRMNKSDQTLAQITQIIDERSLNSLINILNIVSVLESSGYQWNEDENKQKKRISDDSKEITGKEDFYNRFLEVWDSLLYQNLVEGSKYDNRFFTEIITERDVFLRKNKELIANLFYFYWYKRNTIGTIDSKTNNPNEKCILSYFCGFKKDCDSDFAEIDKQLKKNETNFLILLDWLNYERWLGTKNIIRNLYKLAEIAASEKDVILAFAKAQDIGLSEVGIPDLRVRTKEMLIKTRIIDDVNSTINSAEEFTKIENTIRGKWNGFENTVYPKLQFFLWVSGYWDTNSNSSGNPTLLKTCFEQCEEMFNEGMDFRRAMYAVASSMNFDSPSANPGGKKILYSSQDINQKSENNAHLWKDGYFFWDDEEETRFHNAQEKITLRNLYNNYNDVSDEMNQLQEDPNYYKDCWLKYAVIHKKELLSSELMLVDQSNRKGTIGDILVKSSYGDIYFMLLAYTIKNSNSNYVKTNAVSGGHEKSITINAGDTIKLSSDPSIEVLVEKKHNIKLTATVSLEYPPKTSSISGIQENVVYRLYSPIKTICSIIEYEYNPANPFKLTKYVYNLTEDYNENRQDSYSFKVKDVVKQIDNYTEEQMRDLWIDRDRRDGIQTKITTDGYKRGVGVSMKWNKDISVKHIGTNDQKEDNIDI